MVVGRQPITFGTRKARVPAAKMLHAPEWPCPGRAPSAQNGPKSPKTGPGASVGGPRRVRCPSRWTQSTRVLFGSPLGRFWTRVAPKRCPLGPKRVQLGPECGPRAEPEQWQERCAGAFPKSRVESLDRQPAPTLRPIDTVPIAKENAARAVRGWRHPLYM